MLKERSREARADRGRGGGEGYNSGDDHMMGGLSDLLSRSLDVDLRKTPNVGAA